MPMGIGARPGLLDPVFRWPAVPRSGDPHVEPDGAPGLEAADLHQVAELVHEPEAAAAGLTGERSLAPGERLVETAGVRDLADQRVRLAPEPKLAAAAAVPHRVRRQLVD